VNALLFDFNLVPRCLVSEVLGLSIAGRVLEGITATELRRQPKWTHSDVVAVPPRLEESVEHDIPHKVQRKRTTIKCRGLAFDVDAVRPGRRNHLGVETTRTKSTEYPADDRRAADQRTKAVGFADAVESSVLKHLVADATGECNRQVVRVVPAAEKSAYLFIYCHYMCVTISNFSTSQFPNVFISFTCICFTIGKNIKW